MIIFLNAPAAAAADKIPSRLFRAALLLAVLILLAANTLTDLRTMRIAPKLTLLMGSLACALRIGYALSVKQPLSGFMAELVLSLLPGILLRILSWILPRMIGGGDGDVILALGCALSFDDVVASLFWGFLAAGLFGTGLLIRHRNARAEFPFIPFLSAGVIITVLLKLFP